MLQWSVCSATSGPLPAGPGLKRTKATMGSLRQGAPSTVMCLCLLSYSFEADADGIELPCRSQLT
jgi:hypothetical protein